MQNEFEQNEKITWQERVRSGMGVEFLEGPSWERMLAKLEAAEDKREIPPIRSPRVKQPRVYFKWTAAAAVLVITVAVWQAFPEDSSVHLKNSPPQKEISVVPIEQPSVTPIRKEEPTKKIINGKTVATNQAVILLQTPVPIAQVPPPDDTATTMAISPLVEAKKKPAVSGLHHNQLLEALHYTFHPELQTDSFQKANYIRRFKTNNISPSTESNVTNRDHPILKPIN